MNFSSSNGFMKKATGPIATAVAGAARSSRAVMTITRVLLRITDKQACHRLISLQLSRLLLVLLPQFSCQPHSDLKASYLWSPLRFCPLTCFRPACSRWIPSFGYPRLHRHLLLL